MDFTEHLSGGSADLFETSISGRACLATALPLAIDEGYVVLFSPLEEIEADIARMNLWILAAGAIALALAVLASLRISSSVSGRFQELAHSMVRVSQDDYGVRIADVGEDEVTILVRGFNEMLDEIQNRDTALNRVLQERGVAAEGDPPPRQEQPADHLQPPEPPGQQALGQRGRRRLRGEPRPHRFHGPGP
jgi:methyl-accepting chemotaxis protein